MPSQKNPRTLATFSTKEKSAMLKLPALPGMNIHIVMQAGYTDRSSLKNVSNLPGMYKVVFTLSRPGFSLLPDRSFSTSQELDGDSHLAIATPALKFLDGEEFDALYFKITTVNGEYAFRGLPNSKGMLGRVESEPFRAAHFGDAALQGLHAIGPTFSSMSTYLDVPVHVYQMDVVELRTNTHRISVKAPFKDVVGWIPPLENESVDQQKYTSLYREALNSTSSNYQFLCLYRVIEGLRERRIRTRSEVVARALAQQEKPEPQADEKIPSIRKDQIEWLNALYAEPQEWDEEALDAVFIENVLNRKTRNLIDKGQELHKLRNKISHAVLDSGEPMISIDSGVDIDEVEKWLPITKFIARYLLKDAFHNSM